MEKGFLSIILHAHLPYVRHPEYSSFFEENWFFEAITECYLPLIGILDRLNKDRIDYRLTLSLSPTLLTMMSDELLLSRYQHHLQKQLELADKEVTRNRNNTDIQKLARLYRRFFQNTLNTFLNLYQCDLISAFKKHHLAGNLELITTAATHGFLPLLNNDKAAIHNQIKVGIDTFERALGYQPSGFWVPECGFYPGLECLLADSGIRYFFTDSHGLTHASDPSLYGVHAPIDCGNGVTAFARDPDSSQQVWSAQEGYPGDHNYREYYQDIGLDPDLDLDYLGPYILDGSTRIHTGIKYHRITGSNIAKEIYQPRRAWQKTIQHAHDFIGKCQHRINQLSTEMDRTPIIVAPYDAELFGHWWFEGPQWLEQVLRLTQQQDNGIKTSNCSSYLTDYPDNQTAMPSASTWGNQGYSEHWINDSNHWIYPHLHQASVKMTILATEFNTVLKYSLQERALNQANRSLLLAQASDWPFIMKTGTTTEYANKRITDQLARFNYLHDIIRTQSIDERYLTALEQMDNIFPEINFRDYTYPDS